jgi:hypothetical protein
VARPQCVEGKGKTKETGKKQKTAIMGLSFCGWLTEGDKAELSTFEFFALITLFWFWEHSVYIYKT